MTDLLKKEMVSCDACGVFYEASQWEIASFSPLCDDCSDDMVYALEQIRGGN